MPGDRSVRSGQNTFARPPPTATADEEDVDDPLTRTTKRHSNVYDAVAGSLDAILERSIC